MAAHPFGAQPFEEGRPTSTSAREMEVFYVEQQRQELERKTSRRSNPPASKWTRKKSLRKNSAVGSSDAQQDVASMTRSKSPASGPPPTIRSTSSSQAQREHEPILEEGRENSDSVPPMPSRSLVPDTLPEGSTLPERKDDWSAASFRLKHPIHNPVGPRWYKNHHLLRPTARPSSYFSPSFPPMTYASQEAARQADPSRTSSASPQPTPNSSQTGIAEQGGRRSRKTSQTDNVDLLDVTDPWGQNWHHTHPYDLKYGSSSQTSPVSPDSADTTGTAALGPRSRHASLTVPQRGIAPSPLSQSTSALHLQAPHPAHTTSGFRVMRKLSKRRTPVAGALFNMPEAFVNAEPASSPTSPVDVGGQGTKRSSTLPFRSGSTSDLSTMHKERRGSILGRLVKKFSILKRPNPNRNSTSWHHISTQDAAPAQVRSHSPEKMTPELSAPVSEAVVEQPSIQEHPPDPATEGKSRDHSFVLTLPHHHGPDRSSHFSFEMPFSSGRLTIANPDIPESAASTPAMTEVPLPPEKPIIEASSVDEGHPRHSVDTSPAQSESLSPVSTVAPTVRPGHLHHSMVDPSPQPEPQSPVTTLATTPSIRLDPPQISPQMSPASSRNSASSQPFPIFRPPFTSLDAYSPSSEASYTPYSSSSLQVSPPTSQINFTESPMSTSSMLVNPPTPHAPEVIIPPTPGPPVPPKLPPAAAASPVARTETETFRLVKSPSGTIPGNGGNWEVQQETAHEQEKEKEKKIKRVPRKESKDNQPSADNGRDHDRDRHRTSLERLRKHDIPQDDVVERHQQSEKHGESSLEKRQDKGRQRESANLDKRERRREPSPEKHQGREKRHESSSPDKQERRREHSPDKRQQGKERRREHSPDRRQDRERRRDKSPEKRQERENYREKSSEHQHHSRSQTHSASPTKESRSSRRKNEEREVKEAKPDLALAHPANVNKPQPAPPPATPSPSSSASIERRPSITSRPISHGPTAAEMNAMRAREVYELERLYKARSMHGEDEQAHETTIILPPFPVLTTNGNKPVSFSAGGGSHIREAASHGSSHTSYTFQSPFQTNRGATQIYHSMPTAPPPIIYASNAHLVPQSYSNHQQAQSPVTPTSTTNAVNTFPASCSEPLLPLPSSPSRGLASNPLPEPPRESSYRPAPISTASDPSHGRSLEREHWTKLTGLTTAH